MKKYYLLIVVLISGKMVFGQMQNSDMQKYAISSADMEKAKFQLHHPGPAAPASMLDVMIDHDAYEGDDKGYVWRFNSHYTNADSTTNYASWNIDSLAGFTDQSQAPAASLDTWDYPAAGITIDSIFFYGTHENNSNTMDTFVLQLVNIAGDSVDGFPGTTVLYSDTSYSNIGLSTGNTWLGTGVGVVWSSAPNYVVPAGHRVSMVVKYLASKLDTFSIGAGYVKDPASPDPNNPDVLHASNFHSSSLRIPPNIPNIIHNANLIYSVSMKPYPLQNWYMWAKCTFGDNTSVMDHGSLKKFTVFQNQPNPFRSSTTLKYELSDPAQVDLTITDVSGRVVLAQNEGQIASGVHTISLNKDHLSSGVYFYTLRAGGLSQTKKLVVME